ncbi:hypothetical protein RRG08_035049 [Elysia crispata]|uniref:Uncharacterized protein n=1 Tax=Elysia crispata TaxID=231223 RepID=A0AAE0ZT96_9GAST|nr:hypothetical protein RRG08_035049 [Elysia crispata]
MPLTASRLPPTKHVKAREVNLQSEQDLASPCRHNLGRGETGKGTVPQATWKLGSTGLIGSAQAWGVKGVTPYNYLDSHWFSRSSKSD